MEHKKEENIEVLAGIIRTLYSEVEKVTAATGLPEYIVAEMLLHNEIIQLNQRLQAFTSKNGGTANKNKR